MGRLRSVGAVLVGTVAVLGLLVSVLGLWARDVLFDSREVGRAVERTLAEPAVTDALAARITTEVFAAGDVEARVTELAPSGFDRLVPALVGGVRSRVEQRLAQVLATEEVRGVVVTLVEGSHARLMRLLAGDGLVDGISVQDGEVRLNLLPLVGIGLREVQELGFLGALEVPDLSVDGDPQVQIAELEAMLGRDLRDDFGQLTVFRSEALTEAGASVETAQRLIVLAKRALVAVIALTVVAFLGSTFLARRRRRTILVLASISVGVMFIARALVRKVVEEAPVIALDPAARTAIATMLESLTERLLVLVTLTIVFAAAVALVAFVRSDHPWAVRLRGSASTRGSGLLALAARNRDATAFVAFALAVAVITFGGIGWLQFVVAVAIATVGAWALWGPDRSGAAPTTIE